MERALLLRKIAVTFAATAIALAIWFYVSMPTTLRVAVGPADSPQHRYVMAMARALKEAQLPFRLELQVMPDSKSGSNAIDTRKADLAILRSDDGSSVEARSIAVLHKRLIVLIAPNDAGIESIADVKGRSTAIIGPGPEGNKEIVERIAGHYEISPSELSLTNFSIRDFAQSNAKFDAYILVADPSSDAPHTALKAIRGRETRDLVYFGLPAAEGLSLRLRDVVKAEVPVGAFGGLPPLPQQALETVAVTHELVATSRLSQAAATELLGALVDLRTRMRRLLPRTTFDIEPPPVDTPRRFLPHVGAAAYVNDEDAKTFLETYSEQIWLSLFALSIVGSSVTGFLAWAGFFEAPISRQKLPSRLAAVAGNLRERGSSTDLESAQRELDDIVIAFLHEYGHSSIETETELSLALWIAALNGMIERRMTGSEAAAAQTGRPAQR